MFNLAIKIKSLIIYGKSLNFIEVQRVKSTL